MKTEIWNGHTIRFIEVNSEWWAVAKDVTEALGYSNHNDAIKKLKKDGVAISDLIDNMGRTQIVNVINEISIYTLVFKSRKPEAEQFRQWIYQVIKELRQQTGLEGFQVFKMMDRDHQKQAMERLYNALQTDDTEVVKFNSIKANTITNKAVSIMYGLPKMIGKEDMSPDMLADRQRLLEEVVNLMTMKEKYKLDISVSKAIYDSILKQVKTA